MIKLEQKIDAAVLSYLRSEYSSTSGAVRESEIMSGLGGEFSMTDTRAACARLKLLRLVSPISLVGTGPMWYAEGAREFTRYEWPTALWEQSDD